MDTRHVINNLILFLLQSFLLYYIVMYYMG